MNRQCFAFFDPSFKCFSMKATLSFSRGSRRRILWLILMSCQPWNEVNSVCEGSADVEEADNTCRSQFVFLYARFSSSHWAFYFLSFCFFSLLMWFFCNLKNPQKSGIFLMAWSRIIEAVVKNNQGHLLKYWSKTFTLHFNLCLFYLNRRFDYFFHHRMQG